MTEEDEIASHLLNQFRELANHLRNPSLDRKGINDSELVTILTPSIP